MKTIKPKAASEKTNQKTPPRAAPPRTLAGVRRCGHWIGLAVLLGFVLFSRIGAFTSIYHKMPTLIMSPDSPTYENPAKALLLTGRFASQPDRPEEPEIVRTPGYPLFIAAHYWIFGVSHVPVIISQIVLSAAAIALIFLLCLRLRGPRAALIAAILMAFEPISYLYSQVFLTDMPFTFFVALIAAAGVRLIQARETEVRWAWLLGVAIAASAHLRPVNYYLAGPVLAGMLAVKRLQACPPRRLAALGAALALPWLVLVGGWQVRNALVADTAEFSAIQSVNLLQYRAAGVVALRDGIEFEAAQKKVEAGLGGQQQLPPAERYRAYRREALRILREDPLRTLKMTAMGLKLLLTTSPDMELKSYIGQPLELSLLGDWRKLSMNQFYDRWIRRHFQAFLFNLFFMWPLSGVLYFGLVFAPWFRRPRGAAPPGSMHGRDGMFVHLYLAGLIAYLAVVSAGPEANYRFRLALIPLLALYSALGWDKLGQGIKQVWLKMRQSMCSPATTPL